MEKDKYKKLHEEEIEELAYEKEKQNMEKQSKYSANKYRRLFLSTIGLISFGFICGTSAFVAYYFGYGRGEKDSILELEKLQRNGEIKIFSRQGMEKMDKDLEELMEQERAKYFFKGLLDRKKNN